MRGLAQRPETGEGWAALMARAQAGDRAAYHRLLTEITPYVRSIAARYHRTREDVEDAVQDVLLSVHTIRHTYDPERPFGPWLATIADRRHSTGCASACAAPGARPRSSRRMKPL
ncbi:MAG: sigma factor [Pseudomonadota bacterium]